MAITTINSLAIPAGTVVSADLTYPLTGFSSTGIDDNATSTAITIDASENVGIGTASPDGKLNVVKGTASGTTASTSANNIVIDGTSGTETGITLFSTVASGIRFGDASGAGQGVIEYAHGTDHMRFVTNATERMRIDSSGNVGIGTSSPNELLEIKGTEGVIRLQQTGGAYSDIRSSDFGTLYLRADPGNTAASSSMRFHVDASEAMRITSSGRVGIGTTSPSGVLAVTDGANGFIVGQLGENFYSGNTHRFFSQNYTTEHLHIDASGNVGIGTASPANKLDVNGILQSSSVGNYLQLQQSSIEGYINMTGSGNLNFRMGSGFATRMTIDSSGNLLVGTTTARTGTYSLTLEPSNSYFQMRAAGTGSLDQIAFVRNTAVTPVQVGSIATTGSATTYNTSSDYRLKENIVDAPAGNIDAIRVRSFDWKTDGSHQTYGMVAQELVDVAPEAVTQGETEDDMWGVDYSKLVPMMIKEIQDLKAEVAALKGA